MPGGRTGGVRSIVDILLFGLKNLRPPPRISPASELEPEAPYDACVAYLESIGTQWIDTGMYAVSNHKYYIRFLPTTSYVDY